MCSMDHVTSNNQLYFQPDHHQSLAAGTMEPYDHDRHEQRHGGGGQEAEGDRSDPTAVLTTYLTFLEHKIGHLRGILCSAPRPQQQHAIVSAELRCIISQLVSIANDLATGAAAGASPFADGALGSPSLSNAAHEQPESEDSDHAEAAVTNEEEDAEGHPAAGPYEVVQIEKEEILAPHAHTCKVCGKGFKRDANLRMHMRGHGDQYKTPASLAKPGHSHSSPAPDTNSGRRFYYSCPYAGCKRNREHRDFQPLKTPVCVKNHYRRSHCDKSHVCRRCGVKKFSVLADLRTHEKHCGLDRWVCSCGTSFSRKDKLYAHVALFDGHTPAPPSHDDDDATVQHCSTANATATATGSVLPGSVELPLSRAEAVHVMDQCFSGSTLNDFRSSGVKASMGDGRGHPSSPLGIDLCDFDGFDLLKAVAMDFDF